MDWGQWISSVSGNPVAQFIAGFLFLVFGSNAILSERVAKEKFGAFGWIARSVRESMERKAEIEEELERKRTQDLRDEIKRVDEARKADKAEMGQRIDCLERSERRQHRYIVWVTGRIRDLEVWAAEMGVTLPNPRFLSFSEWRREYDSDDPD